jgi:hypothetical protein
MNDTLVTTLLPVRHGLLAVDGLTVPVIQPGMSHTRVTFGNQHTAVHILLHAMEK